MELIADILLIFGAGAAALYCVVLSRRLRRFTDLEKGVGGAIAVLSVQVDDMTKTLKVAQTSAVGSAHSLDQLTVRAETVARRLEMLVASMHDIPEAVPAPRQPAPVPPATMPFAAQQPDPAASAAPPPGSPIPAPMPPPLMQPAAQATPQMVPAPVMPAAQPAADVARTETPVETPLQTPAQNPAATLPETPPQTGAPQGSVGEPLFLSNRSRIQEAAE